MKRSQRVLEANLPTILGYLKSILKKKKKVTFITMSTKTLKKTNQALNGDKSIDGDSGSFLVATIRTDGFPKPFITLRTLCGSVGIIDVDDQVNISFDKIVIKKGFYSETGSGIEVWKFI